MKKTRGQKSRATVPLNSKKNSHHKKSSKSLDTNTLLHFTLNIKQEVKLYFYYYIHALQVVTKSFQGSGLGLDEICNYLLHYCGTSPVL
jgi:hypothetical protein